MAEQEGPVVPKRRPEITPEESARTEVLADLAGLRAGIDHLPKSAQQVCTYLSPRATAYEDIAIVNATVTFAQRVEEGIRGLINTQDVHTVAAIGNLERDLVEHRIAQHPHPISGNVEKYVSDADSTVVMLTLGLLLLRDTHPDVNFRLNENAKLLLALAILEAAKTEAMLNDRGVELLEKKDSEKSPAEAAEAAEIINLAMDLIKPHEDSREYSPLADAEYTYKHIMTAQEAQEAYIYTHLRSLPIVVRTAVRDLQEIPGISQGEKDDIRFSFETENVLWAAIDILSESEDPIVDEIEADENDPLAYYTAVAKQAQTIINRARALVEDPDKTLVSQTLRNEFLQVVDAAAEHSISAEDLEAKPWFDESEKIEAGYKAVENDLRLSPKTQLSIELSTRIRDTFELDSITSSKIDKLRGVRRRDKRDLRTKEATRGIAYRAGIRLRKLLRQADEATTQQILNRLHQLHQDRVTYHSSFVGYRSYTEDAKNYMQQADSVIEILMLTRDLLSEDDTTISDKPHLARSLNRKAAEPSSRRQRLLNYTEGATKEMQISLARVALDTAIEDAEYQPDSIDALSRATMQPTRRR